MKKIIAIGIVVIALLFASTIVGSIKKMIEQDETTKDVLKPIFPELEELEQELKVSGIGSLIGVILLIIPINPGIKIGGISLDIVGAWMFWPK